MKSYLNKKVAAPVHKTEINGRGDRCADHVTPLYPQKLALTSPTGGGRSVGIVRSTFVFPCIVSIIVNDDRQDAIILAYVFIPNQLYVSGDVFAHHQEHLSVFTASDIVH